MAERSAHKITVCVPCRHKDRTDGNLCRPGLDLIERLRSAIYLAGDMIGAEFEVPGTVCMAGYDRSCTIAYLGSHKATYLFGEIDGDENIDDPFALAHQYASLPDGWCSSTVCMQGLSGRTLARIPAVVLVSEHMGRLQ